LVQKPVQVVRQVIDTVMQTGTRIVEKVVPVVRQVTDYVTQQVEESYLVARAKNGISNEETLEKTEITKDTAIINAIKKSGEDITMIAGVGIAVVGGAMICAGTLPACAVVVANVGAVLTSTPVVVVTGTVLTANIINNANVVVTQKDIFGNDYSNAEWSDALSGLITDGVLLGGVGTLKYIEVPVSKLLSSLTKKVGQTTVTLTEKEVVGMVTTAKDVAKGNSKLLDKIMVQLKDINPGRELSEIFPGTKTNCANCSIATDSMLGGKPLVAERSARTDPRDLEKYFGKLFESISGIGEIEQILLKSGNGSRGIVTAWKFSNYQIKGHAFNAVNIDGKIYYLDGQIGDYATTSGYLWFKFMQTK